MAARSGLSRLASGLQHVGYRMAGKQLAGRDLMEQPQRRWVEYTNSDILGNAATVPMTWHSWLRHGRTAAPTEEELAAEEHSKQQLAAKVASLTAADHKLRLQEIAERHLNSGESTTNMERERDQRGGVSRWSQAGGGRANHQQ